MTTIRERLIKTLWKGGCLPERGAELLDAYRHVVYAEAGAPGPWQRAVDGLNALVDSGRPHDITPDGIENPVGTEAIVWDHRTQRWTLTSTEGRCTP